MPGSDNAAKPDLDHHPDRLLSAAEVRMMLGKMSPTQFQRIRHEIGTEVRLGRRVFWRLGDVTKYIERQSSH